MYIYVVNLPSQTLSSDLRILFSPYGSVSEVHVSKDAAVPETYPYAFVEMPDRMEARTAIVALNGAAFGNRELVVMEALHDVANERASKWTPLAYL